MTKSTPVLALGLLCTPLAQAGTPLPSNSLPLVRCESRELLQFNSGYTTPAFVVQFAASLHFPGEKIVHILSGSPSMQHRVSVERGEEGNLEITAIESGLSPRMMDRSHGMWLSLRGSRDRPTEATLVLSARELDKLQDASIAHLGWEQFLPVNGRTSIELRCTEASE